MPSGRLITVYILDMISAYFPVPAATTSIASCTVNVLTPVFCSINASIPCSMAPPPVRTIPRSMISAASSGGVFSRTPWTVSTICQVVSRKAVRISSEVSVATFGSPVMIFLPLTSIVRRSASSLAVPILILIFSAASSPIKRLCFSRT